MFALMSVSLGAAADEVFRIEVGSDYKRYSNSDLQRRVWELERAVRQLQHRVFELETVKTPPVGVESWVCTITAVGNTYTATGGSKAVAKSKVVEACKAARNGDGFFCTNPQCEQ